jgi:tetratricopeptide (TPR) repeat protein
VQLNHRPPEGGGFGSRLADANPSVTDFRSQLASIHYNIGNVLSQTGKPAEALESYQSALSIFQKMARENPKFNAAEKGYRNHAAMG